MKLAHAIALASELHREQTDKNDAPYILHPLRVMNAVRAAGFSEEHQQVAIFHDVLEDTYLNQFDLHNFDLSTPVRLGIIAMTRLYKDLEGFQTDEHGARKWGEPLETYAQYFERCVQNPIARVVKYYDVLDNMDPKRFRPGVPYERYIKSLSWYEVNGVLPPVEPIQTARASS